MATDNSFIPVTNPDITTFSQGDIGFDPNTTPEIIQASSQPLSQDPNTGIITLSTSLEVSNLATFGNQNIITPLPNPNMNGELVLPIVQVGGTLMATDIILGNNGTTK